MTGTFFAPAERSGEDRLRADIAAACVNPVITGLLTASSGMLLVLNEHRQILMVNDCFLQSLGLGDAGTVLGLRPGEAIDCVHAHEEQGGCGTSRFCSTCGAAIAIVACLAGKGPEERICQATTRRGNQEADLCLRVRGSLLDIDGRRFVLLFMQDITAQQRWAELERVFFHDMANTIQGVQGSLEMMEECHPDQYPVWTRKLRALADRLGSEVALQRLLARDEGAGLHVNAQDIDPLQIVEELRQSYAGHPAANGKKLEVEVPASAGRCTTDPSLLRRVLANMLTNAFEASSHGNPVRLGVAGTPGQITFSVWNAHPIPEEFARRIFQRHFSTKEGTGRGLGTYSMKLLGELLLGGRVTFTSTPADGTTFSFTLPR